MTDNRTGDVTDDVTGTVADDVTGNVTDDLTEARRQRLAALLARRAAHPDGNAPDTPVAAPPVRPARPGGPAGRADTAAGIPRRADPTVPVPLTPIQRRLFFLWQLEPDSPAYHLPLVVRLRGPVDPEGLTAALRDLVARHEALRSVVDVSGGEPVMRVRPAGQVPVEVVDDPQPEERLAAHARRPFALDAAPPCRILVVREAEDRYAVALTLHHIATDGRSQDVLLADLADLYAARLGLRPAPPPPHRQHADVAAWQHRRRDERREAEQLEWWAAQLDGVPPVLELPTDRPRPRHPTWSSGLLPVELPDHLVRAVRAAAAETASTPFIVLMAGLQALLGRLAGTEDVTVGMPETGRRHPDTENVVGCLLNTLVVRGDLSGDPTGRELVRRVRDRVLGALAHADVPFERIVQRVRPERTPGVTPLYQVQLNVYDQAPPPRFAGLSVEVGYTRVGTAKFDLAFEFADAGPGGGLRGELEYRTELFDAATAANLRDWYLTLLAGMLADLDRPVSTVPLAPVTGPLLRGPARTAPLRTSLVEWFRDTARRVPDAVAVVARDGSLTYAQLAARAHRIAHRLAAAQVAPDTPVGVLLEPGTDLAAAILGVLSAGAGYLPLDVTHPARRVARTLDLAGAEVVLTTTDLAGRVGRRTTLLLDDPATLAGTPDGPPPATVTPGHLAHVIFTSGSTGEPKGVAVEHRGIVNCVTGMLERTPQLSGASFALVSTIAADLGLASFYGALLTGGTLHLVDREVATDPHAYARYLASHRVDVVKCVPSHLSMLATHHTGELADLLPRRVLVFGGEAVPWELVHRVRAARPDLTVQTHYGPTECAMFSMVCDVDEVPDPPARGTVPLGRLLPGIDAYVLDPAGRPLPAGVPGELALVGPGVSRGYVGRPDLTAQRFGPEPAGPGRRCYRTGDLVRVRPATGAVEFLGRTDDQVKVRGYRVELGEVASACRAVDGVRDAYVLPVGEGHERRLAAWLAAPSGVDAAEVRARLRDRLPDYLVPASVVVMDSLPLTPNGKVDRAALPPPQPVGGGADDRPVVAPRTPTEAVVARAWREVLGVDTVGVDDDFFALGGHSFAATRVVGRLRRELGRPVPLRLLFDEPVLAGLAAALDALADAPPVPDRPAAPADRSAPGPHRIPRRDPNRPAPLSSVQARLWFLAQLEPDSHAYHIPLLLRLRGDLDTAALAGSLRDLVTRHEVLRSVVTERDGELSARVLPPDAVALSIVDATPEGLADAAAEAARRPFRLDRDPPVRAVLFRLGDRDHALGLTFHHIAMDGWAVDLAMSELADGYAARVAGGTPPTPPPIQYADYAAWSAGHDREAEADAAVDWWVDRLAGAPPVLTLPTDHPRPPVATDAGAAVPVELSADLTRRLRGVASETGCTPFMVLLAAWQALLGRLAGTEDVSVGVPVSGRHHPDTERLLGCFVNTLVLRTDLSGDPTGRELLRRVRETALQAFTHARAPFERVVERLQPDRDTSTTPLFQVMLNVVEDDAGPPSLPGLETELLDRPLVASKFDLNLALAAAGDGYRGRLVYRSDLFEPATAHRLVRWYLTLLTGMLADPCTPVGAIPLEPVTGPLAVGVRRDFDLDRPLHALIERWAHERPDAVAVVAADGSLSYAELDARANRLAHALRAAGADPARPVAVLLERRTDLAVAILGVLKAGCAWLPLDPDHPPARHRAMRQAAGADLVVTHRAYASGGDGELLLDDPATLDGHPPQPPGVVVPSDALAYVIFTSGSTGTPKGVAVEHRHIVHYLHGLREVSGPERLADASFALVSTHAADLGLTCLLGALTGGGTAHLVDRDVAVDPAAYADYLARHRVDVVKCVPSHLELLTRHGDLTGVLPRRLLILAGEPCPWELVARIRRARPDLVVHNAYGPTETTVSVITSDTAELGPEQPHGIVPLGRPYPNATLYVVDRAGRPLPAGVPGELWIGGPSVTRGYLGRPEETARRFVPDPVTGTGRCYRTGDRVRIRADGVVEFLGRIDDQVKIRGFRVEPNEVAATLRALPEVGEAVVLAVGEPSPRLVAWVTPATGDDPSGLDGQRLREAVRERLPEHMVPSAVVPLATLPLTPNGKVDRAALPVPDQAAVERVPPTTATQVRVARVWQEVLGVESVGIHDDFFQLGGDSFTAVRAVRAIDPHLRVIDLFTHPTVAELASLLDARQAAGAAAGAGTGDPACGGAAMLHRLAGPSTPALTVVCVPYGGGSAAAYQPLATELARTMPRAAVLAVELPGHDPAAPDEPRLPVAELADRLADEIARTVEGPIAVYGHCVGTAVAVALSRRLVADGREVAGVILGASFPTARLPGRLASFFHRTFGTDRWASNRLYRDTLRAMGGLLDDMDEATTRTVLDSLRHDARSAQDWFTGQLTDPQPRLRVPVLCVVGERDRATELYQERYREWGAFAERVGLATIPRAGHYFLKHQAGRLAELITGALADWAAGRLPEPVEDVVVAGARARSGLRSFYLLATGQLVALVGTALTNFALGFWAFQRSGQIVDYALVTMLALVPTALLAPLGGAVADRVDRRRVMLAAHLVSAAAVTTLMVLLATDRLDLLSVSLLVGLTSVVTAFHQPAYLAAIAQLVPKPFLPQANALAQIGVGASQLVAPLAGGALIALLGLPWVVAINIATFAVGIATLVAVRLPDRLFRRREEPFRTALAGGWRFIVRRRPMVAMVGFFMVVNFFTALMWVSVAPMVLAVAGPVELGAVTAAGGFGAVAGGLAVVPWGGTRRRTHGMIGFVVVGGLGTILMGLFPSLVAIAVGLAVRLGATAVVNAHWLALLQVKVGQELLGRVLAMNLMLALTMQPLGFMLAAPLADGVFAPLIEPGGPLAGTVGAMVGTGPGRGVALMLVCSGVVLAAWGVLGLLYRPLRLLEDELPDAVPGAEIAEDLDQVQEEADRRLLGAPIPVADGARTRAGADARTAAGDGTGTGAVAGDRTGTGGGVGDGRPVDAGDGRSVRVGSGP
ncbi:MAG: amino acid adenylation domain-containing protein [Micromonosporaceae bacterium]